MFFSILLHCIIVLHCLQFHPFESCRCLPEQLTRVFAPTDSFTWITTILTRFTFLKVGFHYPSSRPKFTGRVDGPWTRVHFWHPSTRAVNSGSGNRTPVYTGRVHGRPVTPVYTARVHERPVSTTRVHGPSWRVSKNAPEFSGRQLDPWTRAVNSGSGNRP